MTTVPRASSTNEIFASPHSTVRYFSRAQIKSLDAVFPISLLVKKKNLTPDQIEQLSQQLSPVEVH